MTGSGFRCIAAVLVGAGLLVVSTATGAQQQRAAYRPGLGDLMTTTVQPRHIKLALALRERNWPYAAYELHELEEAFERAVRVWPRWHRIAIDQMFEALIRPPMAELKAAIKAADARRVTAAYARLTDGCNACHQSLNRAVIVIREPRASSFPDQDFRPAPR